MEHEPRQTSAYYGRKYDIFKKYRRKTQERERENK
jgi:hypothetical protein